MLRIIQGYRKYYKLEKIITILSETAVGNSVSSSASHSVT
jgi:hypothetical protein